MRKYIKKLQSKSENTRKRILVGSLIISMSFVFLIWINGLGYRLNKNTPTQTQENIKPFSMFEKLFSDTYTNISASVGKISSSTKKERQPARRNLKKEKQIDLIPVEYQ